MSADLFAEFGTVPSTSASQQQSTTTSTATKEQAASSTQNAASTFSLFDSLTLGQPPPVSTVPSTPAFQSQGQYQTQRQSPWQTQTQTQLPSFSPNPTPSAFITPSQATSGSSTTAQVNGEDDADADDWGDFEGDSFSVSQPTAVGAPTAIAASQRSAAHDLLDFSSPPASTSTFTAAPLVPNDPWRSVQAMPAQDPFALQFGGLGAPASSVQDVWRQEPVQNVKKQRERDPNVLFDVEDVLAEEEEDDEFGDFEEADGGFGDVSGVVGNVGAGMSGGTSLGGGGALVDLSWDEDVVVKKTDSTAGEVAKPEPTSAKEVVKNKDAGSFGNISKPKTQAAKAVALKNEEKEEDTWDTFDDWEASIPAAAPPSTKKPPTKHSTPPQTNPTPNPPLADLQPPLPLTTDAPPSTEQAPTNIPPPALLLSLFPPLFTAAATHLFTPLSTHPPRVRTSILAAPATTTYLQAYLLLARVAAYIIAGRKLRWKRDAFLAQGMRIGPASSRASKGMKLTSIDKAEDGREEREVGEVVGAWRKQVGRLRSVVASVNKARPGTLQIGDGAGEGGAGVPDLAAVIPVRTLGQSEGGVPSRLACLVCGLKRDERVGAAGGGGGRGWDDGVQDVFGEWWVESVSMHRACRNFWVGQRDALRGR